MRKHGIPAVLVAASLSVLAAALVTGCKSPDKPAAEPAAAAKYYCPMHPQVVKDKPGDCPICGMKLVPHQGKTPAAQTGHDAGAVPEGFSTLTIDPRKQQLIGLKTVKAARGPFETTMRTTGRVAFDETRIHHVHTKYDAYVEHVDADFTGVFVKKGQPLLSLYSPDLHATQQEYLLALRARKSLAASDLAGVREGGVDLLEAARQRLLLWDLSPGDIEALERRGSPSRTFELYAPITGYVTGRTAYHGMKVSPMDSLFDIVDLSRVWVLADVYEYELPRVSVGQDATMTLSYWPGRSWRGKVTYVFPTVDEKTRTVKVRLECENPGGELKPEMYADVVISGRKREVLRIPEDAILDSGTRKVVFVALGEGKLQPREVAVGDHAAGFVEVTSGLAEGDEVALGANFLVDSESRLRAALSAFGTEATPAAGGTAARPTAPPGPHAGH